MASIYYAVGDNWGSGFVGNMTVPGGAQGLHGWTVEFDASFTISDIWGAEIVSHVGDHYVVRNVVWNSNVSAGGNTTFGFQATTGASGTAASGLVLNGAGDLPPPVLPTLSIDDASISEGNGGIGQLTFTVSLSPAATGPVTVQYSTADGTATAGSDYSARTGTLTFAAGETSRTISTPILGDVAVEANESFTVALSGASGATIADSSATGTIVNDDVQPPVSGGNSLDYAVSSSWGSGFTATMTVGAGSAGLHGWTVEFNSAASITSIWNAEIVSHVGDHYVVRNAAWNGELGGGKTASFGFQATSGSAGTAALDFAINGTAVGQDPPTAPGLSVADATVVEGNSGSHDLAFTVTLSAPATNPVTVAYSTANGTATAGSDYAALTGTLVFAAGETSKVVHVQVLGDTTVEANETLTLKPYATQDGYLAVLPYNNGQWQRFFDSVGKGHILANDPRFSDIGARTANIDALYDMIANELKARPTAEWLKLLQENDIPCMVPHSLETLLEDPHLRDRGFFAFRDHPSEGRIRTMREPTSWSETPPPSGQFAPRLGQHTHQILTEAGYSQAEIDTMTTNLIAFLERQGGTVTSPNEEREEPAS